MASNKQRAAARRARIVKISRQVVSKTKTVAGSGGGRNGSSSSPKTNGGETRSAKNGQTATSGVTKTGGGVATKMASKSPGLSTKRGARGGQRYAHPIIHRFTRLGKQLADLDIETGTGPDGEFTADDLDALLMQLRVAFNTIGDAISELASHCDGELMLKPSIMRALYTAADLLGSDVSETFKDARVFLRREYSDRLTRERARRGGDDADSE